MRLLLLILVALWGQNAEAGSLVFKTPNGDGNAVSVYPADDPDGIPVANILPGEVVETITGRFVFGIESYAWRSEAIEIGVTDVREISLGGLRIDAPATAGGRFGLLDTSAGRLLMPLSVSETVYVPPGRYLLRRDLAEVAYPVDVTAGEISTLSLGALAFAGPVWPRGVSAFIAEAGTGKIAATISANDSVAALPAGQYMVAASTWMPPVTLDIADGEIRVLPAPVLRWADAQIDGPELVLTGPSDIEFSLPRGQSVVFVAFGLDEAGISNGGESLGQMQLTDDTVSVLWRLRDGRLPLFEGLPLEFETDGPRIIAGGTIARLTTSVAELAEMRFTLAQNGQTFDLGLHSLRPGQPYADILLPEDLSETAPVRFTITGPSGQAMSGQTDPIAVHVALTNGVRDLGIARTGATLVELQWTLPGDAGIAGVDVYRGDETRAVNGGQPIRRERFMDIGLSASRDYKYRVCPVDELGFPGPCTIIEARTAAR